MSEIASQPVVQENAKRHALRRSLIAAGAALVMAHATPALADTNQEQPISDAPTAPELDRVVTPHSFAFGSEDDSAVASGNAHAIDSSMAWARGMGATWWRIMIHPADVQKKNGWKKYDLAARTALKNHLKLNIAASMEGVQWTDSSVKAYFTKIIQRYGMVTGEIAVGNEVNRETMLEPAPGSTQAQTYRHLYQVVQPLISAKGIDVLYGELSSGSDPVGFARAVADCPDDTKEDCQPLKMSYFAYHPYQLTSSPRNPTPDEPGIGSLQIIKDEIAAEEQAGLIQTIDPQVGKPPLALTESGWWAALRNERNNPRIPARLKTRYIPDNLRRNFYRMGLVIACNDIDVNQNYLYGMSSPPPTWPGSWNTGLIKLNGQPTATYQAISSFTKSHPECVEA